MQPSPLPALQAVTLKRDLCPMLQQQAIAVQPGQHVPSTSPAMQRMQRAEQLVKRGVLTDAEVAAHKVGGCVGACRTVANTALQPACTSTQRVAWHACSAAAGGHAPFPASRSAPSPCLSQVAILSSEPDPTLRLLDVASLRDRCVLARSCSAHCPLS